MDKKFLYSMLLATVTIVAVQYYFSGREPHMGSTVLPGKAYRAPVNVDVKPLKRDIDFIDDDVSIEEVRTTVETPLSTYVFSSYGGTVSEVRFKKHLGKHRTPIATILPHNPEEREFLPFLLALDERTPFTYRLEKATEVDGVHEVVYRTQANGWNITKTYVVYSEKYQLDVMIAFEPMAEQSQGVLPRLFVTGPFVEEVENDQVSAFVSRPDGKAVEKINATKEREWFWVTPALCGLEDRYFVHGMVKDVDRFVQRAYFKRLSPITGQCVLEGPEVDKATTWRLHFYVGPKIVEDFDKVDGRLEGLLSFGWLSWLCRILLNALDLLYQYFKNYGWAIVVLTILVKVPFIPLTFGAKRRLDNYQRYLPVINKIRAKYRDNVQKQHEEIMRFHKEHNLSPTTQMVGCFLLLVQVPILFALYRVLNNYLPLYQAPFIGWITDLSAKDPYYILPLLMGGSMVWQQMATPVTDEKQRVIMLFMAMMMVALFSNFPAGLVLYQFVNNLATLVEEQARKKFFS